MLTFTVSRLRPPPDGRRTTVSPHTTPAPQLLDVAGPDDEGGRGLLLVEAIADTWGVDRSALTGGNAVWATLSTGR